MFNLVNLCLLYLSSNNLSDHLNFQLFYKLENLRELSLSYNNHLSSDFKSDVNYSFPYLNVLEPSSISLTELPNLSRQFPRVSYLDLSNNQFNGRVPDNWIHEMNSLNSLNFSHNLLASAVVLFSWIGMFDLDLSFNLLTGDISLSICNASLT